MKAKRSRREVLKGVPAAVLAPKGRFAKSIADPLSDAGCSVALVHELPDLFDLGNKTPPLALFVDTGFCEAYQNRMQNQPREAGRPAPELFVAAAESAAAEGAAWARALNAHLAVFPLAGAQLEIMLERALDAKLVRNRLASYEEPDEDIERFGPVAARSAEMRDTVRVARILAQRDDCLLLAGGVGSGKEMLARAIHAHSPRRHGPFYAVNCNSFSGDDLAAEVFGRGDGPGGETPEGKNLLELCEGGTLMLDNIGVIPPGAQGKLQRFLEDKTYTRVNSRSVRKADVRVIAASPEPLAELTARGDFSEDLYFHINRFTLHLPALRRRIEDIPVLVRSILKRIAAEHGYDEIAVREDALNLLTGYSWPGNVRELENALDYAALVSNGGPIQAGHLPKQFHDEVGSIFVGATADDLPPMSEIERQYILRVMEAVRGNKVKAAQILDINRATLHRKLQIYQNRKPDDML